MLQSYLSARPSQYRTHPRLFDTDCLHTPYLPPPSHSSALASSSKLRSPSHPTIKSPPQVPEADLLSLDAPHQTKESVTREADPKRRTGFSKRPGAINRNSRTKSGESEGQAVESETEYGDDDDFEEEEWVPDVFVFEYGTVVIWGMTEREEKRFLASL
jgi:hypothetical protein